MQLRPRITVQFEITGDEPISFLAQLKIVEREAELALAVALGDFLQQVLPNAKFADHVEDGTGRLHRVESERDEDKT